MNTPARPLARSLLAVAATLLLASAASAQPASPDAAYQQDRAACLAVDALHERNSCLREAGAVRAEAGRGQRSSAQTPESRAGNALQRCSGLPPENQVVCERMVRGEGTESGSVAAGGTIRQLETREPASEARPTMPMPPR